MKTSSMEMCGTGFFILDFLRPFEIFFSLLQLFFSLSLITGFPKKGINAKTAFSPV